MADLLQKGLTEEGHTVTCASDGAEGLALAKAYEFDVIILDVMMPGLNGYEVCQRLKSDPTLRQVRVLMLSAKGRDVEVAKGLELGADAYITKPFSTRELVSKVRELLGP